MISKRCRVMNSKRILVEIRNAYPLIRLFLGLAILFAVMVSNSGASGEPNAFSSVIAKEDSD